MSLEFFGTILVIVSGFFVNWWANKAKLKELSMKQLELEAKHKSDAEKSEQDKKKADADLSDQFLGIAERSGKQVATRDVRIEELQAAIGVLQGQVGGLIVDKRRLEDESIRKDSEINSLKAENVELRARVKLLEGQILMTPGGKKDDGTTVSGTS